MIVVRCAEGSFFYFCENGGVAVLEETTLMAVCWAEGSWFFEVGRANPALVEMARRLIGFVVAVNSG